MLSSNFISMGAEKFGLCQGQNKRKLSDISNIQASPHKRRVKQKRKILFVKRASALCKVGLRLHRKEESPLHSKPSSTSSVGSSCETPIRTSLQKEDNISVSNSSTSPTPPSQTESIKKVAPTSVNHTPPSKRLAMKPKTPKRRRKPRVVWVHKGRHVRRHMLKRPK